MSEQSSNPDLFIIAHDLGAISIPQLTLSAPLVDGIMQITPDWNRVNGYGNLTLDFARTSLAIVTAVSVKSTDGQPFQVAVNTLNPDTGEFEQPTVFEEPILGITFLRARQAGRILVRHGWTIDDPDVHITDPALLTRFAERLGTHAIVKQRKLRSAAHAQRRK